MEDKPLHTLTIHTTSKYGHPQTRQVPCCVKEEVGDKYVVLTYYSVGYGEMVPSKKTKKVFKYDVTFRGWEDMRDRYPSLRWLYEKTV